MQDHIASLFLLLQLLYYLDFEYVFKCYCTFESVD